VSTYIILLQAHSDDSVVAQHGLYNMQAAALMLLHGLSVHLQKILSIGWGEQEVSSKTLRASDNKSHNVVHDKRQGRDCPWLHPDCLDGHVSFVFHDSLFLLFP
jgi:hypothetical protein